MYCTWNNQHITQKRIKYHHIVTTAAITMSDRKKTNVIESMLDLSHISDTSA